MFFHFNYSLNLCQETKPLLYSLVQLLLAIEGRGLNDKTIIVN